MILLASFLPRKMAELQARIEAANKELAEAEARAEQEQVVSPAPVVEEVQLIQLVQCMKSQEVAPSHYSGPTPATEAVNSEPGFAAPQESVTIL